MAIYTLGRHGIGSLRGAETASMARTHETRSAVCRGPASKSVNPTRHGSATGYGASGELEPWAVAASLLRAAGLIAKERANGPPKAQKLCLHGVSKWKKINFTSTIVLSAFLLN